jgi:ubiquinone/menaquinone biosynthesis C-methylase UbiE
MVGSCLSSQTRLWTGITVSRWQVDEAMRRVVAAGLRGRVSIQCADASALPFDDGTVDAVLAFDSVPNAEDKGQWLGEMYRVLRPGGRLVFSEYPKAGQATPEELEILKGYAILNPPPTAPEVVAAAAAAGFEVLNTEDFSDQVRRTYSEFAKKLAEQRAGLVSAYGEERIARFEGGITVAFSVCEQRLGYLVVTCRKPSR